MSKIRVTVREAWQEVDPTDGRPIFRSALLTTLEIEDAGSIDQNRTAARAAVNIAAGGRASTLSFTGDKSISATVRRAEEAPAKAAPPRATPATPSDKPDKPKSAGK